MSGSTLSVFKEAGRGTARRSASRTPRRTSRGSARPRRRARGGEGWPCPSPRRRASRGRIACRTTAAGPPGRYASSGQYRELSGVSTSSTSSSFAGLAIEAPLELRVGQDQAPAPRVVGGLVRTRAGSAPGVVPARSAPSSRAIVANGTFSSWPDSALVAGVKIGSIRSLSTSPAGKGVAADGPRRPVLAPGAAREIAPDDALERDDLGLLDDHRPAGQRLAGRSASEVEARVVDVGGDQVVGRRRAGRTRRR